MAEAGFVEQRHRIPVGEDKLDALAVQPTSGTKQWVVLLHGGPGGDKNGPSQLYSDLATLLATEGVGSLRFDMRGVGQSTGTYRGMTVARQVEDLRAAREFLGRTYAPESVGVVGESFGATVALAGIAGDEQAFVLLWPVVWFLDNVFNGYVTEESLAEARNQGFIIREGTEIGLPFLEEILEMRDVAGPLDGMSTPMLLIHGDADREVPFGQSARAEALAAGPKRRVIVPGGDHCLREPQEREIVYRETVSWLTKHL